MTVDLDELKAAARAELAMKDIGRPLTVPAQTILALFARLRAAERVVVDARRINGVCVWYQRDPETGEHFPHTCNIRTGVCESLAAYDALVHDAFD